MRRPAPLPTMPFRCEDRIDDLARDGVFPERGTVDVVQTHISVVCLVGDRAYKLKKAVALPFLDFSSPERRADACRDELRLNRRLCPDVYLDVVPVRDTEDGLRVAEAPPEGGDVADHAVRMVRLPADRMLDRLLEADAVTREEIEALARHTAAFHARVAAEADAAVRAAGAPGALVAQIRANFEDTRDATGRVLDAELHDALHRRVERALPTVLFELDRRAAEGRVVEGHGDLHARNVCMTDPPAVYDCIEFRRDFRCADVATEVAFMAMDLRFRGHRGLADAFVAAYVTAAGDRGLPVVLPELVRYRAMVRAKVDAIAAADPSLDDAARARAAAAARRHLRLAAWTRIEDDGAVVLIATGLPASGKSHVLDALAAESGWPVHATDRVRKQLAGAAPSARLPETCYTSAFSDRTYAEVVARAIDAPGCAVLDGNFPSLARRRAAIDAVRVHGKRAVLLHFVVDPALARERLRARAGDAGRDAVSDADEQVYERLRTGYEEPSEAEGAPVRTIDGSAERDRTLDALAAALLG